MVFVLGGMKMGRKSVRDFTKVENQMVFGLCGQQLEIEQMKSIL